MAPPAKMAEDGIPFPYGKHAGGIHPTGMLSCFALFSAVNRVKKRQNKLEGAELKITVMEAACQRENKVTGQKDKFHKL